MANKVELPVLPMTDNEALLVIAKAFGEDKADRIRNNVKPGQYEFDFSATFRGSMKVGENFPCLHPASIRPMLLASILMSKVNDATMDAVVDEYAKALKEGEEKLKEMEGEVKRRAESKIQKLVSGTLKMSRGRVKMEFTKLEINKSKLGGGK